MAGRDRDPTPWPRREKWSRKLQRAHGEIVIHLTAGRSRWATYGERQQGIRIGPEEGGQRGVVGTVGRGNGVEIQQVGIRLVNVGSSLMDESAAEHVGSEEERLLSTSIGCRTPPTAIPLEVGSRQHAQTRGIAHVFERRHSERSGRDDFPIGR